MQSEKLNLKSLSHFFFFFFFLKTFQDFYSGLGVSHKTLDNIKHFKPSLKEIYCTALGISPDIKRHKQNTEHR